MGIKYHCDCCDKASDTPIARHESLGDSMFCAYCMNGIMKFANLLHSDRWEKEYAAIYENIPKQLPGIIKWAEMCMNSKTAKAEDFLGRSFFDLMQKFLDEIKTKGSV